MVAVLSMMCQYRKAFTRESFFCTTSKAWRYLGTIARVLGIYTDAERFYRWAYYWSKKASCSECIGDTLRRIACLRVWQGDPVAGERISFESIEHYRDSKQGNEGYGWLSVGYARMQMQQYSASAQAYHTALEFIGTQDSYYSNVALQGYLVAVLRNGDRERLEEASQQLRAYKKTIPPYHEIMRLRLEVAEALARRRLGRLDTFHLRRKIARIIRRFGVLGIEKDIVFLVSDIALIVAGTQERSRDHIEHFLRELLDLLPRHLKKKYAPLITRLEQSLGKVNPVEIVHASRALRRSVYPQIEAWPEKALA